MTEYPKLEALLPHRAPMILLDHVQDEADGSLTCKVTLRPESPFVENGSVPAVVATEYMAQCVAAYAGLRAVRRGEPVQTGYLIGARTMEFAIDAFSVGEELIVKVRHVWGDDILGNFQCTVDSSGRRVASAVLTVFQGDPDAIRVGRVKDP